MNKITFSGYTVDHSVDPETSAEELKKFASNSAAIIRAIESACPDALIASYELNHEGFLTIRVIPDAKLTKEVLGLQE